MDSKGKQRLTGAIIVVALFVLLVPELLTGPKDGPGTAPSEEGMRKYTIDIDAPTSSVQPVSPPEGAPAMSLPPVVEASQPDAQVRAEPGEAAQAAVVATTPAPAPTPAAKPEPRPTSEPVAPKPASTVAATPPAPRPEPAKVESPRVDAQNVQAPKVEVPRPTSAASGSFAVQLGSFVSKENADRLVKEMTAKGFNAFVAPPIKSGGRDLYRVRVGPTRDRAASEALAVQLRRIGQSGSVVPIS
jgi:cell division septation protein DedD